jgi:hypothetical protein
LSLSQQQQQQQQQQQKCVFDKNDKNEIKKQVIYEYC